MLHFILQLALFLTLLLGIIGARALLKGRAWRNRRASWDDWMD